VTADAIDRVTGLFNRLTPQEVLVVGALTEVVNSKRQKDPRQKSATAGEIENVFLARKEAPPAVQATLQKLASDKVLGAEPRDNDIFYELLF
jgi:hypothetical protein